MARPTFLQTMIPPGDYVPVITNTAIAGDIDLPKNCRGIYNSDSAARNISVTMANGNTRVLTFPNYVIMPGEFIAINQTGTDAAARSIFAII